MYVGREEEAGGGGTVHPSPRSDLEKGGREREKNKEKRREDWLDLFVRWISFFAGGRWSPWKILSCKTLNYHVISIRLPPTRHAIRSSPDTVL